MHAESSVEHSQTSYLKDMQVTVLTLFCTIFAIGTFIFDVSFDIAVAYQHFNDGNKWFFILTVVFITVPAITMAGFSLYWYLNDSNSNVSFKVSTKQWVVRAILILFLAPVLRNFEALYYAFKSWKSKKPNKHYYARRSIFENTDAALLRLFEAFMECGPQLTLQIYIIGISQSLKPNHLSGTETTQLISIVLSVISMSSAIVTYGRTLRSSLDDKKELPCSVSILPGLWRFFELSSRVIALGLFASVFPKILWVVFILRFIIMTTWICSMKTEFCDNNQWAERFYNLILGLIFTFCYFNPKDTPTRFRMVFFYLYTFMENTLLIVLWYLQYPSFVYFKLPALVFQVLSFNLSIVLMVLYYYYLHPTVGKFYKESTSKQDSAQNIDTTINEDDIILKEKTSELQNGEINENSEMLKENNEMLKENGICENQRV